MADYADANPAYARKPFGGGHHSPTNWEGDTPRVGNVGDNLVGSLGLGRNGPGVPAAKPVAPNVCLLGRLKRGLSSGLTGIELPGPVGFGRTWVCAVVAHRVAAIAHPRDRFISANP